MVDPETQMRLHLERETRILAEAICDKLRAGVGFTLVLFDEDEGGSMAYCSTGERGGVVGMLGELLSKIAGPVEPNLEGWTDEQLQAWKMHIAAEQRKR